MNEDLTKLSDEELIDTWQQLQEGYEALDEARQNVSKLPIGSPYGLIKGMERLEDFERNLREVLEHRGIDPDRVVAHV